MFLIQDTDRKDIELEKELKAISENGFEFKSFGTIYFTKKITGLDDIELDKFVVRCGTKILHLLTNNEIPDNLKWLAKGIFYDPLKFDQEYYSKLGLPLLNDESKFYDLKDILNNFYECAFIKPTDDRKSFDAMFIENDIVSNVLEKTVKHYSYLNSRCLVSEKIVKLDRECRFYVVDGKVITGSHYRIADRVKHVKIDDYDEIWKIADEYSKLYQPHDVFVMDIAQVVDEYKIIEYNCLNASGLYGSNVALLFKCLIEYQSR